MKKHLLKTMSLMLILALMTSCSSESTNTNTNTNTGSQSNVTNNNNNNNNDDSETSERTMDFYNGDNLVLPEKFDNFVVLDYSLVDNFISLGYAPTYGTRSAYADSRNYKYAERLYENIEGFDLESVQTLNTSSDDFFEDLLLKAPDFIIITEGSAKNLENYSAIAPTFIFPTITDVPEDSALWKENFKLVAEFVNEVEKGQQMLAEYDQLVEDSRALVADEIEGKTALVVQLNEVGFKLRMPETQASVYADIGFGIPEGLNEDYATTGSSSADGSYPVETLTYFNPDYIMIHNQSVENYNALLGTPVWENISAVSNGDVYEIAQSSWNHTNGYSANTCRLKDLVIFIMDKEQVLPDYLSIS
ncbi:MAG: ABC transporter substrate-binding protein [Clostridia bacterium]